MNNKREIFIFLGSILFLGGFIFTSQTQAVNYQASNLLGQLDGSDNPVYTSSTSAAGARGLSFPTMPVIDSVRHRLFLSDCLNSRVLVFNLDSNNNLIDRVADNVLGQPNFSSTTGTMTQSGLNTSCSVAVDLTGARLFVGDGGNNRILIFDINSVTDGEDAISVLGGSNFTSSFATTSQTGLQTPSVLTLDSINNLLYVIDGETRIMVFDVATTTSGEAAVHVLGQQDFASYAATTSQSGLNGASVGVLDSNTNRLFVADKKANRVLIYDVSSISDGEPAIGVLGQSDFTTSASGTSQTAMYYPEAMAFDSSTNTLFVSTDANRILMFDVATTTNGQAASNVLGQPDFTSNEATTTQGGFNGPLGMFFDPNNHRLYVADSNNHRVVVYDFIRITNSSFSSGVVGSSYGPTISIANNQGTTTLSVVSGTVPSGLNSLLSGTPTAVGTYSFTLRATDAFPSGNIIFNKAYTITIAPEGTPSVSVSVPTFTLSQGGGGGMSSNAIQAIKSIQKSAEDLASSTKSMEETMKSRTPEEKTMYVQITQLKLISLLTQLLGLLQQLLTARSAP